MSIAEREGRAIAYIEKCARRRERDARRRRRSIDRFMRIVASFAAGVCAVGLLLVLA